MRLSAELAAAHRPAPAAFSMKERRAKGECGASLPMQTSQYEIGHEDRPTCGPLTWLRKNQPRLPQLQPCGLWLSRFSPSSIMTVQLSHWFHSTAVRYDANLGVK